MHHCSTTVNIVPRWNLYTGIEKGYILSHKITGCSKSSQLNFLLITSTVKVTVQTYGFLSLTSRWFLWWSTHWILWMYNINWIPYEVINVIILISQYIPHLRCQMLNKVTLSYTLFLDLENEDLLHIGYSLIGC